MFRLKNNLCAPDILPFLKMCTVAVVGFCMCQPMCPHSNSRMIKPLNRIKYAMISGTECTRLKREVTDALQCFFVFNNFFYCCHSNIIPVRWCLFLLFYSFYVFLFCFLHLQLLKNRVRIHFPKIFPTLCDSTTLHFMANSKTTNSIFHIFYNFQLNIQFI